MELRILELAIRILDPRRWRLRLAQLGGGLLATLWIWFRAVDHADVDRAVRDAKRAERRERIRAGNAELERGKLSVDGLVTRKVDRQDEDDRVLIAGD